MTYLQSTISTGRSSGWHNLGRRSEPSDDVDVLAHGIYLHGAAAAAALEAATDDRAVGVGKQPAHVFMVGVAADDDRQSGGGALDLIDEAQGQLLVGVTQSDG